MAGLFKAEHLKAEHQIDVQVNGDSMQVPKACTLSALVDEMELSGKRVAIELNLDIVPKSEYLTTTLNQGDVLEIVHAIGGG